MSGLNPIDILIVLIFVLSMVFGLIRGFLKEVISVLSWIAATLVAMTFASPMAAHFAGTSSEVTNTVGASAAHSVSLVALGICFVVLFILTLFIGSIVGYVLSSVVNSVGLGFVNRILGACFGLLRGFILVIIFMFIAELTPLGSQPAWAQSVLVQDFQPTVAWFSNLVQPGIAALKAKSSSALQGVQGAAESTYSNAVNSISGK
jgi:membrane protein required for colicin V production